MFILSAKERNIENSKYWKNSKKYYNLKEKFKMKKLVTILLVVSIVFSLFLFQGCGKKKDEDVIKIGAVLPLTGYLSELGSDEKIAIELGIEKFDTKNKIEIIYKDSKGQAKESLSAVSQLINQGVDKIILSTSSVVLANLGRYNSEEYLFIAQCMSPNVVENYKNAIRIYASVDDETDLMADYINKNNLNKLSLMYINNDFGQNSISELLHKVDIKKDLQRESFSFGDKNYKNQIAKIKDFNPNALTIYSYPQQWPNIIHQLDQYKFDKIIIANSGLSFLINEISRYNISENILAPIPKYIYAKEDKRINSFKKLLKQRTDKSANYDIIYFYDMMKILINNLYLYPNLNNQELIIKITSKNYNGVSGELKFNNRDAKSIDLKFMKIKNISNN